VLLAQNTQINHAEIGAYVTPFNRLFDAWPVNNQLNPLTAGGRAALDGMITVQASWVAYLDDFKLLMWLSIGVIPLLLIFRTPKSQANQAS
jgi:MFS transporter, DHA2 family, multidrug resistance protein